MKKLRILIISTFFPPLNSIASHRPYSWAKYWHLSDHDVTVLTTQKQGDSCNLNLINPGFKIIEVPISTKVSHLKNNAQSKLKKWLDILRNRTGILSACRMPELTHFWVKPALNEIMKEKRWDLVISTSGPYPVHLIGKKLKEVNLAGKWIADFRDLWTDNHIYKGLFPFTIFEKLLEKQVCSAADIITTVSPPLANILKKKYGESKVHTIENGFDPELFTNLPQEKIFPKDGKVRLVYTGVIYPKKQNIEPLFSALQSLNDVKYEVILAGPKQDYVKSIVEKYQVQRYVKFEGLVDIQTSLRLQRDADYLIFLPWIDNSFDGIYSGKIFEYLNSVTPILAIGCEKTEASQELIISANAGFILRNTDEICNFLKENKLNRRKPDDIFLKNYNRKYLAEKLLKI